MLWSGIGVVIVWSTLLGIALAAESQAPIPKERVQVGHRYFVHLTRIAQRRGGHFPMAEIRAYIDGRIGVPAHGRRDMPVWGERLEEMLGGSSLAEAATRSYIQYLVEYLKAIQASQVPARGSILLGLALTPLLPGNRPWSLSSPVPSLPGRTNGSEIIGNA